MPSLNYPKIAQLKSVAALKARLEELGLELPLDERILTAAESSPLASPLSIGGFSVGNRWCIHPMEGWDAASRRLALGTYLAALAAFRRQRRQVDLGRRGGGRAEAGRANPHQTLAMAWNRAGLAALLDTLVREHQRRYGTTDDLLVGLQLTHSGRFCRPNSHRLEPRIAYHHPLLDAKFGIDPRMMRRSFGPTMNWNA